MDLRLQFHGRNHLNVRTNKLDIHVIKNGNMREKIAWHAWIQSERETVRVSFRDSCCSHAIRIWTENKPQTLFHSPHKIYMRIILNYGNCQFYWIYFVHELFELYLAGAVCVFRFPILNSIKHAIATRENPWKKKFCFPLKFCATFGNELKRKGKSIFSPNAWFSIWSVAIISLFP